jgi:hypothetical protein
VHLAKCDSSCVLKPLSAPPPLSKLTLVSWQCSQIHNYAESYLRHAILRNTAHKPIKRCLTFLLHFAMGHSCMFHVHATLLTHCMWKSLSVTSWIWNDDGSVENPTSARCVIGTSLSVVAGSFLSLNLMQPDEMWVQHWTRDPTETDNRWRRETILLHLKRKLRMRGAIPHFPIRIHGVVFNYRCRIFTKAY